MQYSISSNLVVAMMHDRAACNVVALRALKVVYPMLVDVGCFSHTLDLVGKNSLFPIFQFSQFGGLAFSPTAQSPSCSGGREQEEQLKDTLQQDGGVNLK